MSTTEKKPANTGNDQSLEGRFTSPPPTRQIGANEKMAYDQTPSDFKDSRARAGIIPSNNFLKPKAGNINTLEHNFLIEDTDDKKNHQHITKNDRFPNTKVQRGLDTYVSYTGKPVNEQSVYSKRNSDYLKEKVLDEGSRQKWGRKNVGRSEKLEKMLAKKRGTGFKDEEKKAITEESSHTGHREIQEISRSRVEDIDESSHTGHIEIYESDMSRVEIIEESSHTGHVETISVDNAPIEYSGRHKYTENTEVTTEKIETKEEIIEHHNIQTNQEMSPSKKHVIITTIDEVEKIETKEDIIEHHNIQTNQEMSPSKKHIIITNIDEVEVEVDVKVNTEVVTITENVVYEYCDSETGQKLDRLDNIESMGQMSMGVHSMNQQSSELGYAPVFDCMSDNWNSFGPEKKTENLFDTQEKWNMSKHNNNSIGSMDSNDNVGANGYYKQTDYLSDNNLLKRISEKQVNIHHINEEFKSENFSNSEAKTSKEEDFASKEQEQQQQTLVNQTQNASLFNNKLNFEVICEQHNAENIKIINDDNSHILELSRSSADTEDQSKKKQIKKLKKKKSQGEIHIKQEEESSKQSKGSLKPSKEEFQKKQEKEETIVSTSRNSEKEVFDNLIRYINTQSQKNIDLNGNCYDDVISFVTELKRESLSTSNMHTNTNVQCPEFGGNSKNPGNTNLPYFQNNQASLDKDIQSRFGRANPNESSSEKHIKHEDNNVESIGGSLKQILLRETSNKNEETLENNFSEHDKPLVLKTGAMQRPDNQTDEESKQSDHYVDVTTHLMTNKIKDNNETINNPHEEKNYLQQTLDQLSTINSLNQTTGQIETLNTMERKTSHTNTHFTSNNLNLMGDSGQIFISGSNTLERSGLGYENDSNKFIDDIQSINSLIDDPAMVHKPNVLVSCGGVHMFISDTPLSNSDVNTANPDRLSTSNKEIQTQQFQKKNSQENFLKDDEITPENFSDNYWNTFQQIMQNISEIKKKDLGNKPGNNNSQQGPKSSMSSGKMKPPTTKKKSNFGSFQPIETIQEDPDESLQSPFNVKTRVKYQEDLEYIEEQDENIEQHTYHCINAIPIENITDNQTSIDTPVPSKNFSCEKENKIGTNMKEEVLNKIETDRNFIKAQSEVQEQPSVRDREARVDLDDLLSQITRVRTSNETPTVDDINLLLSEKNSTIKQNDISQNDISNNVLYVPQNNFDQITKLRANNESLSTNDLKLLLSERNSATNFDQITRLRASNESLSMNDLKLLYSERNSATNFDQITKLRASNESLSMNDLKLLYSERNSATKYGDMSQSDFSNPMLHMPKNNDSATNFIKKGKIKGEIPNIQEEFLLENETLGDTDIMGTAYKGTCSIEKVDEINRLMDRINSRRKNSILGNSPKKCSNISPKKCSNISAQTIFMRDSNTFNKRITDVKNVTFNCLNQIQHDTSDSNISSGQSEICIETHGTNQNNGEQKAVVINSIDSNIKIGRNQILTPQVNSETVYKSNHVYTTKERDSQLGKSKNYPSSGNEKNAMLYDPKDIDYQIKYAKEQLGYTVNELNQNKPSYESQGVDVAKYETVINYAVSEYEDSKSNEGSQKKMKTNSYRKGMDEGAEKINEVEEHNLENDESPQCKILALSYQTPIPEISTDRYVYSGGTSCNFRSSKFDSKYLESMNWIKDLSIRHSNQEKKFQIYLMKASKVLIEERKRLIETSDRAIRLIKNSSEKAILRIMTSKDNRIKQLIQSGNKADIHLVENVENLEKQLAEKDIEIDRIKQEAIELTERKLAQATEEAEKNLEMELNLNREECQKESFDNFQKLQEMHRLEIDGIHESTIQQFENLQNGFDQKKHLYISKIKKYALSKLFGKYESFRRTLIFEHYSILKVFSYKKKLQDLKTELEKAHTTIEQTIEGSIQTKVLLDDKISKDFLRETSDNKLIKELKATILTLETERSNKDAEYYKQKELYRKEWDDIQSENKILKESLKKGEEDLAENQIFVKGIFDSVNILSELNNDFDLNLWLKLDSNNYKHCMIINKIAMQNLVQENRAIPQIELQLNEITDKYEKQEIDNEKFVKKIETYKNQNKQKDQEIQDNNTKIQELNTRIENFENWKIEQETRITILVNIEKYYEEIKQENQGLMKTIKTLERKIDDTVDSRPINETKDTANKKSNREENLSQKITPVGSKKRLGNPGVQSSEKNGYNESLDETIKLDGNSNTNEKLRPYPNKIPAEEDRNHSRRNSSSRSQAYKKKTDLDKQIFIYRTSEKKTRTFASSHKKNNERVSPLVMSIKKDNEVSVDTKHHEQMFPTYTKICHRDASGSIGKTNKERFSRSRESYVVKDQKGLNLIEKIKKEIYKGENDSHSHPQKIPYRNSNQKNQRTIQISKGCKLAQSLLSKSEYFKVIKGWTCLLDNKEVLKDKGGDQYRLESYESEYRTAALDSVYRSNIRSDKINEYIENRYNSLSKDPWDWCKKLYPENYENDYEQVRESSRSRRRNVEYSEVTKVEYTHERSKSKTIKKIDEAVVRLMKKPLCLKLAKELEMDYKRQRSACKSRNSSIKKQGNISMDSRASRVQNSRSKAKSQLQKSRECSIQKSGEYSYENSPARKVYKNKTDDKKKLRNSKKCNKGSLLKSDYFKSDIPIFQEELQRGIDDYNQEKNEWYSKLVFKNMHCDWHM